MSSKLQLRARVGLMREVQAVVSRAGKRNLPHKLFGRKEDDKN